MKNLRIAGVSLLALSLLSACVMTQPGTAQQGPGKVKNLILMIGDGMGPQQVGLLEEYARRAPHSRYQGSATAISTFASAGITGFSLHGPYDALVVDSACSATQLATGLPSRSEMIGLDAEGNPAKTLLERAKAMGKSTGLVSDTRMTHATPAAFIAHQAHRSMENEIAEQMVMSNQADVLMSGGVGYFLPADAAQRHDPILQRIRNAGISTKSKRDDNKHLLQEAENLGYQFAFNRDELISNSPNKLIGLFASSAMQDGITYHGRDANINEPSLRDMTVKALEILSRDPNGFFLMIEGGQIDWAGHNNDAGMMLHEMLKFDEAIQAVYDWVRYRNDTLVVITADHETGGFGFSYSRKDVAPPSTLPGSAFEDKAFYPNFNFGDLSVLDKLYAQKKNFYGIWREAHGSNDFPTVESLMQAVNANTEFPINEADAKRVLEREANEYQIDGHKTLSGDAFPKVYDFKEFYVYGDDVHQNLIGRVQGKYQNIVWSTGTHTHTPVPVIAWGPMRAASQFRGINTHVELGSRMAALLEGTTK
ncbi:alkaline phosphatase [Aliiglaciecola sp. CAU 1673]|uniref:alkaline phosphatase n=1 Tax=Aliiglaciecola sp. CAU 1673 TaxID=3032595 RepID=UPI0023DBCB87|nr:alkaline phosphatase [Aliiglaciecola sp. CAU 1673]MDF2177790.1 alkaline phosphatase [Aliiglaciecola sp. CAU 1673]